MNITDLNTCQPWRVGISDTGFHHLSHMLIGIIVEEGWACLTNFFKVTIRQKTGFDKSLKPITDTDDEATPFNEAVNSRANFFIK